MGISDEKLNYLMTSDFISDDLSNEDLIVLLKEFRHFYRLQHGKLNAIAFEISKLKNKIEVQDCKINDIETKLLLSDSKLQQHLNRKLTIWERIKGKIQNEIRTI